MTTPIPTGFPDWSRRTPQSDSVYLVESNVAIGAATFRGPFYVGDVPNLGLRFQSITGGIDVAYLFYDDQALTHALGQYEVALRPGCDASFSAPIRGPWVRMLITAPAYPVTYTTYLIAASQSGYDLFASADGNVLLSYDAQAIAGGATVTQESLLVRPGDAHWVMNTEVSGTWRARLYSVLANGVANKLLSYNITGSSQVNTDVILPATPIRCVIQNLSANPGTYYLALVGKPLYP